MKNSAFLRKLLSCSLLSSFRRNSDRRNINWSSPETLTMDTANIDFAADVWSLGMVIHEIISGEVPFDSEEFRSLKLEDFLLRLKDGVRPPVPKDYKHINWLKELVRGMML